MIDVEKLAREAVTAYDALQSLKDQIRQSQKQPHSDFWHQSICEKEAHLAHAMAAIRALLPAHD